MKTLNIKIKTRSKNYSILIGNNILKNLDIIIKKNSSNFNKCLIIVDKNVPKKFLKIINTSLSKKNKIFYFFKPNEQKKSFSNTSEVGSPKSAKSSSSTFKLRVRTLRNR